MKQVIGKLAERVKALRKARGWIQPVLASKAGLSEGYIARLETRRHDPRLSTLIALAKALRVDVAELLK
jgi:transcriptional regulator with XRE-family HTH domain